MEDDNENSSTSTNDADIIAGYANDAEDTNQQQDDGANDLEKPDETAKTSETETETAKTSEDKNAEWLNPQPYYKNLNETYQNDIKNLANDYAEGKIDNVEFETKKAQLQVDYIASRQKIDTGLAEIKQQINWLESPEKHPDWKEVGQSNEFSDWLSQQPPGIQQMANEFDAKNYDWLLTQFKAQNTQADAAKKIQHNRNQILAQNVAISAKSANQPEKSDDDDMMRGYNY